MKRKGIWVTIIAATLCLAACVLAYYRTVVTSLDKGFMLHLKTSACLVGGLLGGYLAHNMLHELGHALFARIGGAKVFEVAFWGLRFSKGRVRIEKSSAYAGWTSFIPLKPEYTMKAISTSLIGGFVGSLVVLIIIFVAFFLTDVYLDYYTSLVWVSALISTVYMIAVNFLSPAPETDGHMLGVGQKAMPRDYLSKLVTLEYQSHLLNSRSLNQVESLHFDCGINDRNVTHADVLLCLERGDTERAKVLIETAVNKQELADNEHIALLLEWFFICCAENNQENINKLLPEVESLLLMPTSEPAVLRCAAFYRRQNGETAWADALEKTYFKACECHPLSGLGKTERIIYFKYANVQQSK